MASTTDPHTKDYADRIAKGLRHDGYKNKLTAIDGQLVASRYGVQAPTGETTIAEISLVVAQQLIK